MAQASSPTALVTGAAGQDGVLLSRLLLSKGYQVIATTTGKEQEEPSLLDVYCPGVQSVVADITDLPRMASLLSDRRPDVIFNLAALSSVGKSWSNPVDVAEVNGIAVLGLVEAIRVLRDKTGYSPRLVQASSSEIYGPGSGQTEESPINPTSPYAVSKAFAHHSARVYRDGYDLFVSNAILFNHESPLRPAAFVTRKITQAAAAIAIGQQDRITLGNIDISRDWGAAVDYVEAMYLISQNDVPDDFNVCTGQSHSLREFAMMALQAAGLSEPASYLESDPALFRPADVPETLGDGGKMARELAWKPTHSLQEIIGHMVAVDRRRLETGVAEDPAYLDQSDLRLTSD